VPLGNPLLAPSSLPGEYLLQGTNPVPSDALFGQLSFQLSKSLQLQVGARYTESSTSNNVQVIQYGLPLNDQQSATFVNTSGKVSLNWTVDDHNFLYGFVSTGFRPGGLNVPVGLGTPAAFGAEKLTDYELGWKATNFDGHLRTQVDGFYYVYRDFQVTVGYPLVPTFGFELNDPNASHLYGFEAQAQAAFGPLSFEFGTTLMHSSLGQFFATDSRIVSTLPCDPSAGPASSSCIDLSGHPQTYAPNFTFNFSTQYRIALSGQDSLTPRLSYAYVSPQYATLFDDVSLGDHLSGRSLLGAQLAWAHGRLVTTLYGTNLTDQHYVSALNSGLRFAGAPRQYGVRLLTSF
jgi:iron complex outermembrane receptor protein